MSSPICRRILRVSPVQLPSESRTVIGTRGRGIHALARGEQSRQRKPGQPETTARSFDDGWFVTGDAATIGPDGFHRIVGRKSIDIIKTGGYKVGAGEVEAALLAHPGVAEAAVIGLPHPKWSERPLLILMREEGSQVSAEEVLRFLDGKIAKWWMPSGVEFVDEIPHTATGKIQKMALREQFKDYEFPQ